jgi:hypothetical protein
VAMMTSSGPWTVLEPPSREPWYTIYIYILALQLGDSEQLNQYMNLTKIRLSSQCGS